MSSSMIMVLNDLFFLLAGAALATAGIFEYAKRDGRGRGCTCLKGG